MKITVTGKVTKRCPFVDEFDEGTVTLHFDTDEAPELHGLAASFGVWRDQAVTHETFTAAILTAFAPGCVKVVSTWTTAGLDVTCEAS